jgi:hypothetical protein
VVLADFFKPALLARMEVVPYLPLSRDALHDYHRKLARLDSVLCSRFNAEVVIAPEVTDEIMQRVTRAENGARMLESVIDGEMLPPLSLLLLQKMAANAAITRISLGVTDGAFYRRYRRRGAHQRPYAGNRRGRSPVSHAHVFRYLTMLATLTAFSTQAVTSPDQVVPGVALAVAAATVFDIQVVTAAEAQATVNAMNACRKEPPLWSGWTATTVF